jgi:hypothetical protein
MCGKSWNFVYDFIKLGIIFVTNYNMYRNKNKKIGRGRWWNFWKKIIAFIFYRLSKFGYRFMLYKEMNSSKKKKTRLSNQPGRRSSFVTIKKYCAPTRPISIILSQDPYPYLHTSYLAHRDKKKLFLNVHECFLILIFSIKTF